MLQIWANLSILGALLFYVAMELEIAANKRYEGIHWDKLFGKLSALCLGSLIWCGVVWSWKWLTSG